MSNDVGKLSSTNSDLLTSLEHFVEVCVCEAKMWNVKRGRVLAALADRVGARKEVSACAVAIDEVDDFELFDEVFGNAPNQRRSRLG